MWRGWGDDFLKGQISRVEGVHISVLGEGADDFQGDYFPESIFFFISSSLMLHNSTILILNLSVQEYFCIFY